MTTIDVDHILAMPDILSKIDTYIVYVKKYLPGAYEASPQQMYQQVYGSLIRRYTVEETKEILREYLRLKNEKLGFGDFPFGFRKDEYDQTVDNLSKFRSKSKSKSKSRSKKSKSKTKKRK